MVFSQMIFSMILILMIKKTKALEIGKISFKNTFECMCFFNKKNPFYTIQNIKK